MLLVSHFSAGALWKKAFLYCFFQGIKVLYENSVSIDLQCHLTPILLINYYNVTLQWNYNAIFVEMHMTVAVISQESIMIGIEWYEYEIISLC